MAADLGRRKAAHIADATPDVVVTSNPGCILQIGASARAAGHTFRVLHIVELLDASLRGELRIAPVPADTMGRPIRSSPHG
jgi:glycolate oxidase iron-sulfur subunit